MRFREPNRRGEHLSLVDPDNRSPVDFAARQESLNVTYIDDLAANWRDGRIKQFVIARVLAMRKKMPRLFAEGTYYSISQYSALSVK